MQLEASTLIGRHVLLEPLRVDHAPASLAAANRDRSTIRARLEERLDV